MKGSENIGSSYFYSCSDFSDKENNINNSYFHYSNGEENDDNLRFSQYSNNDLSFNINSNYRKEQLEQLEKFYNSYEKNNSAEKNHNIEKNQINEKKIIKIDNQKLDNLDHLDRIEKNFRLSFSNNKSNDSENEKEDELEEEEIEEDELEEEEIEEEEIEEDELEENIIEEEEEDEELKNKIKNKTLINKTDDEFLEKSFSMAHYFDKDYGHSYTEELILRFNDLTNNFKKINEDNNILKNTFIRCFIKKGKENHDKQCNCVPLIEFKKKGLLFICEKQLKQYIKVDKLLKLILNGELFANIKNDNNCLYNDRDKKKVYENYNYNINYKLLKAKIFSKDLDNKNEILNYKKTKKKIYKLKKVTNTVIKYENKYFNESSNEYNKVNNLF